MRFLLFIVFLFLYIGATAKTIHVGAKRTYKNIRAAVEAAVAGDTILVDAGIYKEKNLVIKKSIVLKGINQPVLDGEKKYEIISIMADGTVVEGFRIVHSGISSMEDLSGIKV